LDFIFKFYNLLLFYILFIFIFICNFYNLCYAEHGIATASHPSIRLSVYDIDTLRSYRLEFLVKHVTVS